MFNPLLFQKYWSNWSKTSAADGNCTRNSAWKFGSKIPNHWDNNAFLGSGVFYFAAPCSIALSQFAVFLLF